MPSGIPGNVSRVESAIITAELVLTTNPPTRYGDPVVLDSATGKVRPFGAGDVSTAFYGNIMRPYPTQGAATGWPNQATETAGVPGTPYPGGICNILKAGYISVVINGTALAVKGAPVWVRIAGGTVSQPVGGIEAVVDPVTAANTIKLPTAYFMGPQDASGNSEIYVFAGNS
jgi:hypothetical protein